MHARDLSSPPMRAHQKRQAASRRWGQVMLVGCRGMVIADSGGPLEMVRNIFEHLMEKYETAKATKRQDNRMGI